MHATLMWVHPQWLGKRLTALEQFLENQTRLIERAVDGLGDEGAGSSLHQGTKFRNSKNSSVYTTCTSYIISRRIVFLPKNRVLVPRIKCR